MDLKKCEKCGGTYLHDNKLHLCADCARKFNNTCISAIQPGRMPSLSDTVAHYPQSKREYLAGIRAMAREQYA